MKLLKNKILIFLERFPLPLGAWDGLRYFNVALPEPSYNYFGEVTRAIDRTNLSSAPSPEEKVFSILIKTGGDNMAAALLHLFQTCWSSGTLCKSFKLDPKILIVNLVKIITTQYVLIDQ